MPPEIRQRLGIMQAWPLRMVVAFVDRDGAAVADYARRITTYDDDPVVAGGEFAGMFPGSLYSFSMTQIVEQITTMLEVAASSRLRVQVGNGEILTGVRELITELVPAADRDAALALLNRQPTDGRFGIRNWRLKEADAGLADLYIATAIAAWCVDHPLICPSRQGYRRMILTQAHDAESTAHGVPEIERHAPTDQQALALLDAVMGIHHPGWPDLGIPQGQSAINRDPDKRSLIEVEVIEAAKAHLLDHPVRTEDTDRILADAIGRAMNGVEARRARITAATGHRDAGPTGMTDTERSRAAKLADRQARRTTSDRPEKRKRR